jgi:putative ABC transport system permease protein
MLGVVIGVAAAILLMALVQGAAKEITSQIEGLGANVVIVVPGRIQGNDWGMSGTASIGLNSLTARDLDALQHASDVARAAPLTFLAWGARRGTNWATGTLVVGTTPDFAPIRKLALASGRFLRADDGGRQVCVIGESVAKQLFGSQSAAGRTIAMDRNAFRVIGVLARRSTSDSPFGGSELDSLLYIPFETVARLTGARQIHRIIVEVRPRAGMTASGVLASLRKRIASVHGGVEDFTLLTPREILGMVGKILGILTTVLVGIATIALVVGGIGIMNIMLVSVTERTREIGIRKTVGARRRDIFAQFLLEAVLLSLAGGGAGIGAAFVGAAVIATRTQLRPAITVEAIALAAGVCVVVGVLFGTWPAVRAARRDPIEALRFE